ncbi:uncharacterized protein E0L32_010839 [Thyridium curvatum]|uniref:Uncharacterized protein n=1 Tax=Thyridium curvatum TaxID=1093900 RepID=A0A507ADS2_9PEZI|nr:uncharacterized protein E0L32_010839 [Thyridium curvatum]TPX07245.1 hypothetical protein E0L32_010839 [Thyridium curvatum]
MDIASLTTVFTPAASCISNIYLFENASYTCVGGKKTVPCGEYHLGPTTPSTACLPTGWSPATDAYFSPGIHCPSGYTTACSNVITVGIVTETRATCCPSSYNCQTASNLPFYSSEVCSFANPVWNTFVYTSSVFGGDFVTSSQTANGINAYGIKLRWQSSDIATATPTTTPEITPEAVPGSSQRLASSMPTGLTRGGSTGLSAGAKAGIGVGAAAAVVFLLAGALLLWRRLRRQRSGQGHASEKDATSRPHEVDGESAWKAELHVPPPYASKPHMEPVELAAEHVKR